MRKKYYSVALFVVVSLFSYHTFAANSSDEEDLATFSTPADVGGDPGAAPINEYLIPMLVLGVLAGHRLLNIKTQSVHNPTFK